MKRSGSWCCAGSNRGDAEHDAGFQRTGRLAKVAGRTGGAGHATRPSELAPIGSGLLAWPFVTHTPPKPRIAFRIAPPYVDIYGGERLGMGSTAIGREASRVST
jgi:hypothetical protein